MTLSPCPFIGAWSPVVIDYFAVIIIIIIIIITCIDKRSQLGERYFGHNGQN